MILKNLWKLSQPTQTRCFSVSALLNKKVSGKYFPTRNHSSPLTYEMAHPPEDIGHQKSWNSLNTSALLDGLRTSETTVEDEFIRRFMKGTWHNLFVSEVIIKRHHNIIRIAGIVYQGITQRKMYFLIGYSEELLSYWLQCPVKLELQTVNDRKAVVYKHI
ncbi:small ribosomal subunit protein uS3m [Planococcus citri]|uniref:small ribosomal subunit protein uS3m n=1 Tax=Planococcus citri TaxID=170843 RepID=UPI0031F89E90